MAFRGQNSNRRHDVTPSYYVNNNLYSGSYARNDMQGRTSRRMHEGLSIDKNYGLDTVSDDVNSSPYSSPYYKNGRYTSDQLTTQRSSSASVQGCKKLLTVKDRYVDFTDADVQTTIEMWQGKQIYFNVPYNGKLVGNTIRIKNTGGSTGILSIYISAEEYGEPIYETAVDLCEVSQDKFEHIELRSNTVLERDANPRGVIYVRMAIWNELSQDHSSNPFNTGKKIEIAATGLGNHYQVTYKLSDKNTPITVEHGEGDASSEPNRPCIGLIYNDWESIPTERTEPTANGATVAKNGYIYDLYCIKNGTEAQMLVYDVAMNKLVDNQIKVDGRAEHINMVQGKDWIYYTDGYSNLQKFQVGTWVSQVLPKRTSSATSNPADQPSIITKANNRIYLAGFRGDPNFVQVTEIQSDGSNFDSFPYQLYVPNQSPLETSHNPVTAMVEIQSDKIMICGKTFFTQFTSNTDIENNTPQQVSTYTDGGGVESQGDICNYHGVIYSFNHDEGIRRFTGATWEKIPASLDSHIARVDMDKPRKLWGFSNKLYFNYTDLVDGKPKCLIWDMDMNYQQFPWFMDEDIPFCDYRYDEQYIIRGIHPDYPCIMQLYAPDTWRRLDSPIDFERHTKYISLPGNAADMVLKRVHNKVLANSDQWWYFGLTFDKHSLTQIRGDENWYRIPCWATQVNDQSYELPFPIQDEYEKDAVALLSIYGIKAECISVQEKVLCRTFRNQACLISTVFEAQEKIYL